MLVWPAAMAAFLLAIAPAAALESLLLYISAKAAKRMTLQQLKPTFPTAVRLYPFAPGPARSNSRSVPARASGTASEVRSASCPVLAVFICSLSTKCSRCYQGLAPGLEYYPHILRVMR
jgi:hypothetical protein